MKKHIALPLAGLFAALTLLSGCAPMFQRPYSSSVDHVEYAKTVDSSILRAETYRGLVDAILYYVNAHAAQGVVRLYNYTGDVDEDLKDACAEVLREDPLAAFAVEDISYECSRIVSYYEATLSLTYSHTAQEVDAIQFAAGADNLRQELKQALASFSPCLVLRVSYFPGGADAVRDMAVQAWYDTPQAALEMPEIQAAVYPDNGAQRIVEVGFQWSKPQGELAERAEKLLALAQDLMAANPPAQGQTRHTPEQLAALLQQTAAPADPAGASDPYSALTGESANQLSHALALELLLQLNETQAVIASGRNGEGEALWLIVSTEAGWRHLPLTGEQPQLYTDPELAALGYVWNAEVYPACADLSPAPPAETASPPQGDGGASDR